MDSSPRPTVFVSYSHRDEPWKDRLVKHLRVLEGDLEIWDDRRIDAGDEWLPEIEAAIAQARAAVLLISADFLTSPFIRGKEVPEFLRRRQSDGLQVIPVIVYPCPWQAISWLSKIQCRPKDGRELASFPRAKADRHLSALALEIRNLLEPPLSGLGRGRAQPLIKLSRGDEKEVLTRATKQVEARPAEPEAIPGARPRTASELWRLVCEQLQQELDPGEFATWFLPLKIRPDRSDRLVLLAPNSRFLHTLEESYRPVIDRAVETLGLTSMEVFFELEIDETEEEPSKHFLPRFNPKYRFETFVVGKSNEFACAAARSVAETPSRSYNPLFIYGGVGLGKTHLLHAIGSRIERQHPQLRVLYLAAEQFVSELINSNRFDRMPAFRERYRAIDVLLIDDVQFLANKERTQEEFFHTFSTLYTSQKQIILSSDSSPRNIPVLEERLRTRFEWGLIADIQPPDLETKMEILQRRAYLEDITLPVEVAEFIAQQVRSNIRELEGLLLRVMAFSAFTAKPVSKDFAMEVLKDILPQRGNRPAANTVLRYVARHYGLTGSAIRSKRNSQQVVFPRKVAMYLLRRLCELPYPEIGKLFGDKHHSTVMYAVRDMEERRAKDIDLDRLLESLERHFS